MIRHNHSDSGFLFSPIDVLLANPGVYRPSWATKGKIARAWGQLTPDEIRVVILLSHGRTAAQVGPALGVAAAAAERLISTALGKLWLRSIADLTELHAPEGQTRKLTMPSAPLSSA